MTREQLQSLVREITLVTYIVGRSADQDSGIGCQRRSDERKSVKTMDEPTLPPQDQLMTLSSAGLHLPVPAMAYARSIREGVYQALLATLSESDLETRAALLWACNLHPLASWWIHHRRTAQASIAETLLKLQSARRNAGRAFLPAEREIGEH